MADVSDEPSMEEILASIKRIIAEDSDAALSPTRPKRMVAAQPPAGALIAEPDILELTETIAEDAMPAPLAETEPPVVTPPIAAPPMAEAPAAAAPVLASEATVSASRSAIAALSALVVRPDVAGGDTLEGLVREMLKPMLAEWLDARLPEVVERLVAQEIKRITERG